MDSNSLNFGERVLKFYGQLQLPKNIPPEFSLIAPHLDKGAQMYMQLFFRKFFALNEKRIFVLGINPGRFGSGITGVPFTDAVALENACGIPNMSKKRKELTSQFIYWFIESWGGPKIFFEDFFLSAVCPIGFERNGVNRNYYDKEIFGTIKHYLVSTLKRQCALGAECVAIVLGMGNNQRVFDKLNDEYCFFESVHVLEHPRFIMQYRRKYVDEYLLKYQQTFNCALGESARIRSRAE